MPVTTRRAHILSLPCWWNLPQELILHIMQHLPPPAIVQVSGCCRLLRKLAYEPSLWTSLDFGTAFKLSSSNMTDSVLGRFLRRIDAANSLTSISLVGCIRLSGAGLLPLVGSTCLTSIDLRRSDLSHEPDGRFFFGCQKLSPDLASTLLEPMLERGQLKSFMAERIDMRDSSRPLYLLRPEHYHGPTSCCDMCISMLPPSATTRAPSLTMCGICNIAFCDHCVSRAAKRCCHCDTLTCLACARTDATGSWSCVECDEFGPEPS